MWTAGRRFPWVARVEHVLARDDAASPLAAVIDLI